MTKGKFLDELGEQLCMRTQQEVGCLVWGRCSFQLRVTVLAELPGLSFANEMVPSAFATTKRDLCCGHVCTCTVLPKGPKAGGRWEIVVFSLSLAFQSG